MVTLQEKVNVIKEDLKEILGLLNGKSQDGDLTWLLIEMNLLKVKLIAYLEGG